MVDPHGMPASKHDHTYMHARGLAITTSVRVNSRTRRRSFAWVAVTKIKITKIDSEGLFQLFTKFSTPENYPPYGIIFLSMIVLGPCTKNIPSSITSSGTHLSGRLLLSVVV